MQRYMASELPQGVQKPQQQNVHDFHGNALEQAIQHATQLGYYVLEQRGREGAAQYVQGLLRVLPQQLVEPVCTALRIPMPLKKETSIPTESEAPKERANRRTRNEPDMETILRLMQLMKGDGKQDLSALMHLMSGRNN